ncbi:MAG: hypothetical protein K8T10_14470 [Candidatus Eremiobacteraeota bacterium]|nr:hypothetical protein [Candidatus Eremiobacteraeota bacterium]
MADEIEIDSSDIPVEFESKQAEAEKAFLDIDLDTAKHIYLELTIAYPKLAQGWFGLARVYFMEESFPECARAYKKCILANPTSGIFNRFLSLSLDNPEKLFGLAEALYKEALYDESMKFTDRLVELKISLEERTKVLVLREELHNLLADKMAEKTKEYKKGERGANVFMKSIIGFVLIGLLVGFILLFLHVRKGPNIQKGRAFFQSAYRMKMDSTGKVRQLKHIVKEYGLADEIFQDILKKNPNNAQAHYWLARTYWEIGKVNNEINIANADSKLETDFFVQIQKHLDKAIQLDSNNIDTYILLGRLKMKENKLKDAKDFFEKAIEISESKYSGDKIKVSEIKSTVQPFLSWVNTKLQEEKTNKNEEDGKGKPGKEETVSKKEGEQKKTKTKDDKGKDTQESK